MADTISLSGRAERKSSRLSRSRSSLTPDSSRNWRIKSARTSASVMDSATRSRR